MSRFILTVLLILCFLTASTSVLAQKRTTTYIEIFGNGYAWGSLNIDYRIGNDDKGLGLRVGLSYGESANFLGMVNYLMGASKHKVELGAGILNFSDRDKLQLLSSDIGPGIKPTFNISYRYHGDNGLILRAGWTPFIIDNPEVLYTWLGVGIGWKI